MCLGSQGNRWKINNIGMFRLFPEAFRKIPKKGMFQKKLEVLSLKQRWKKYMARNILRTAAQVAQKLHDLENSMP